jgi:hypothetical protein
MAEVTAEDLKFPKSVIARIIKDVLPEGAKISKVRFKVLCMT